VFHVVVMAQLGCIIRFEHHFPPPPPLHVLLHTHTHTHTHRLLTDPLLRYDKAGCAMDAAPGWCMRVDPTYPPPNLHTHTHTHTTGWLLTDAVGGSVFHVVVMAQLGCIIRFEHHFPPPPPLQVLYIHTHTHTTD
jgi:hypothetical protein